MLTIDTIKSASAASDYYFRGDYYLPNEQPGDNSLWQGRSAEALGLKYKVDRSSFSEALEGKLPNGEVIPKKGNNHRCGFDLTFSAPKSVSLLAILGKDEQVLSAHQEALKETLTWIEANFAECRVKEKGEIKLEKTKNLVVATFEEYFSRELDPDLHTHCVVLNATQRADGKWRALHGDSLYKNKMYIGMKYRERLAEKLQEKGFELVQTNNQGLFELADFPKAMLSIFSERREQIVSLMEERGWSGAKAASQANLATRASKKIESPEQLEERHDQKLKGCGHDRAWFKQYSEKALERGNVQLVDPWAVADKAVTSALNHLTEHQPLFQMNELTKSALGFGMTKTRYAHVLKTVEKRIQSGEVIYAHGDWLTTKAVREQETLLVNQLKQGKDQVASQMFWLKAYITSKMSRLDKGGQAALTGLMSSTHRYQVLEVPRSEAFYEVIKKYVELISRNHSFALGLVKKETQKAIFGEKTRIERVRTLGETLAYYAHRSESMNHQSVSRKWQKDAQRVWIVAPDAPLSFTEIHDLLKRAEQFGARVVFVAFEKSASRTLRMMVAEGIPKTILNPSPKREQAFSIQEKILTLKRQGHVFEGLSFQDKVALATRRFMGEPHQRVIVTATNQLRRVINEAVRERLTEERLLTGEAVSFKTLQSVFLSYEQKQQAAYYQLGDVLRINQNGKEASVVGEGYWQVISTDVRHGTMTLQKEAETRQLDPKDFAKQVELYREESRALQVGDRIQWTRSFKLVGRISGETAEVVQVSEEGITLRLKNGQESLLQGDHQVNQHWDYAYTKTPNQLTPEEEGKTIWVVDSAREGWSLKHKELSPLLKEGAEVICHDLNKLLEAVNAKSLPSHALALKETAYQRGQAEQQSLQAHPTSVLFPHLEKAIQNTGLPKYQALLEVSEDDLANLRKETKENQEQGNGGHNATTIAEQSGHPWEQYRLACKAVDEACAAMTEKEAVFDLSALKLMAYQYVGIRVQEAFIDRAIATAVNRGVILPLTDLQATSRYMVGLEKGTIELMENARRTMAPLLPQSDPLIHTLQEDAHLTRGQKEAVALVLTTSDRVIGIQGIAGSGKTTMLRTLNRMCAEINQPILGLSGTVSAKSRLKEGSQDKEAENPFLKAGIPTLTTRRFLLHAEQLFKTDPEVARQTYGNQLIVVDESSFLSNKEGFTLVSLTDALQSRVVLLGDVRQLGSVEAGRIFYLLLGKGMASAVMNENVRFKNPDVLRLMQELYAKQVEDAIHRLDKMERVYEIPDAEERLRIVATSYVKQGGPETPHLLVTPLNEDRQALNHLVRQELKGQGKLKEEIQVQVLLPIDRPFSERDKAHSYEVGEWVRFSQPLGRIGVERHDYLEIIDRDLENQTLKLKDMTGKTVQWSPHLQGQLNRIELYKAEPIQVGKGEKIRWRRNDEIRGIINGETATVIDLKGDEMLVSLKNNETLSLDLSRLSDQHWDYAYAMTVHTAQGLDTTHSVFICASGPKPLQKYADEIQVGDILVCPKEQAKVVHPKNGELIDPQWATSITGVVQKIQDNQLTVKVNRWNTTLSLADFFLGKKEKAHDTVVIDISKSLLRAERKAWEKPDWAYYPKASDERTKSYLSLCNFLVSCTRSDKFCLATDYVPGFLKALQEHSGLKSTPWALLDRDWKIISEAVESKTTEITGLALTQEAIQAAIKKAEAEARWQKSGAKQAFRRLDKHGNVIELVHPEGRAHKAAQIYLEQGGSQQSVLLLVSQGEERSQINRAIREAMEERRLISHGAVTHRMLCPILEEKRLRDTIQYRTGFYVHFEQGEQPGVFQVIRSWDATPDGSLFLVSESGESKYWKPWEEERTGFEGIKVYEPVKAPLSKGERIQWTRSDEARGLIAGEVATVVEAHAKGIVVETKAGKQMSLEGHRFADLHWDYCYARTVDRVSAQELNQAKTVLIYAMGENPTPKYVTELSSFERVVAPSYIEGGKKGEVLLIFSVSEKRMTVFTDEGEKSQKSFDISQSLYVAEKGERDPDWYVYAEINPGHEKNPTYDAVAYALKACPEKLVVVTDYAHRCGEAIQASAEGKRDQALFTTTWIESPDTFEKSEKARKLAREGKASEASTRNKVVRFDKEEIVARLQEDALGYVESWLGKPSKQSKNEARWGKKSSLMVKLEGPMAGSWYDFSEGAGGRDLISLYMREQGKTFQEALEALGKEMQLGGDHKTKRFSQKDLSEKETSWKEHEAREREKKIAYAQKLYKEGRPIEGTLAEKYLRDYRRIEGPLPDSFRFMPYLKHPDTAKQVPALIAPIQDKDGEIQGVVRIFLGPDGDKLNAEVKDLNGKPQKMVSKANLGVASKGAVLLQQGKTGNVFLAEGIETALSVAMAFPKDTVIASLSVGQLKNVPLPTGTKNIVLCADDDGTSTQTYKAISQSVTAFLEKGMKTFIALPEPIAGQKKIDFNDLLKQKGLKAIERSIEQKMEIKSPDQLNRQDHNLRKVIQQNQGETQKMLDRQKEQTR